MYTQRIQIINYGPIAHLDIEFPFEGDNPKPVVLVGENGSGKSILLSHIVNALLTAKDRIYPDTPEVEKGKVFKFRSGSYIKHASEAYFARVAFENDLYSGELRSSRPKQDYGAIPEELAIADGAQEEWRNMEGATADHPFGNIHQVGSDTLERLLTTNCLLYFPHNRYEEPAWLNQVNLSPNAEHMDLPHIKGYTSRRLINYSPLQSNRNWLYDVVYDRAVFEAQTVTVAVPIGDPGQTVDLPVLTGYSGAATSVFDIALELVRKVMKDSTQARFGIGPRLSRVVSLESARGTIVSNIFQLSSGETALLNLFLSILRDFDLTGTSFTGADQIRGIAIVDEVDLHLHAVHQHEILPSMIQMFPKVQFIVTTHSPLFVLGMATVFGEGGFAVYRLPQGHQISPEEFSEFGDAYQAFTSTSQFAEDIQTAIRDAQIPILYVEGSTDKKYLCKVAELLDRQGVLEQFKVVDGGGSGKLTNIWRAVTTLSDELVPRKVVILFDCEVPGDSDSKGNRFKCKHPLQSGHPVRKGIENLFGSSTLGRARGYNEGFFDITPEHPAFVGGQPQTIPEAWSVREGQKTALCDWLCEHGTVEDFRHFQETLDLLGELLQAEDIA